MMLFSNMDFNFAHFEIEESFVTIWVKLKNGRFHLPNSISGISKVVVSSMSFIFANFVYKVSFRQIWVNYRTIN